MSMANASCSKGGQRKEPIALEGKPSAKLSEPNGNETAKSMDHMAIEIVSKENITPSSPTPNHLRLFKLSVIDQTAPSLYVPLLLFYLNNLTTPDLNSVVSKRSKQLKESLSETLTRFYPFAGKVTDNFHIDCNDEGVYYVETRVSYRLSDFLSKTLEEETMIHRFVPENVTESPIGNYVIMIQVNIFSCGGIAISTCFSHKFIDGNTYIMFLEAWTALARGSSDIVNPSFDAPSLFPQIPSLSFKNPVRQTQNKIVTRRFVFDGPNIAALKAKTTHCSSGNEPTRFEAVAALVWKCAVKAASKTETGHSQRPFNLGLMINLRGKSSVPKNSIGNVIWIAIAQCKLDKEIELHDMVEQITKCKAEINGDFIDAIKGESGTPTIKQMAEMMMMMNSDESPLFSLLITSMCNTGIYEFDFGWGKPVWFYYCNNRVVDFVSLCDTKSGGGIQAVVSLSDTKMAIFEQDPELLAFASLNPAPL